MTPYVRTQESLSGARMSRVRARRSYRRPGASLIPIPSLCLHALKPRRDRRNREGEKLAPIAGATRFSRGPPQIETFSQLHFPLKCGYGPGRFSDCFDWLRRGEKTVGIFTALRTTNFITSSSLTFSSVVRSGSSTLARWHPLWLAASLLSSLELARLHLLQ